MAGFWYCSQSHVQVVSADPFSLFLRVCALLTLQTPGKAPAAKQGQSVKEETKRSAAAQASLTVPKVGISDRPVLLVSARSSFMWAKGGAKCVAVSPQHLGILGCPAYLLQYVCIAVSKAGDQEAHTT